VNLKLLREEWAKPNNGDSLKVKNLLIRTHPLRRAEVLKEDSNSTAQSILKDYQMLKRSSYVSLKTLYYYMNIQYTAG